MSTYILVERAAQAVDPLDPAQTPETADSQRVIPPG